MQITINLETVKTTGRVLFVLAGLFSFGAAVHYANFRRTANPVFQVMEFDLNSRRTEIAQRYEALKAAQAKADAAAATPSSTSTSTSTTLPKK